MWRRVVQTAGLMVFLGVATTAVAAPPSEYDCGVGKPDRLNAMCKCPPSMRAARDGRNAAVCLKPKLPDADGDGINVSVDRCPKEPEDLDGFQDLDGCPDRDDDGDGLPDRDDACPREAEDRDGDPDKDGCPDAAIPPSVAQPTENGSAGSNTADARTRDVAGSAPRGQPIVDDEEPQDQWSVVDQVSPRGRGQRRLAIIAGAAGLVAFGVGTAYGLKARSRWNDVTSACTDQDSHYECDASGRQASADARSAARISTIAFASGGAALIASVVLYMTAPAGTSKRSSVGVDSTQGGATITYAGSF